MYDYLVGMFFDEVVELLSEQGVYFDFGESSVEEMEESETYELYVGGFYSDEHYDLDFDEDGRVLSVEFYDEVWC